MVSLPFEFTHQSISDWLSQFKAEETLLMSHELYKVLNTLKKEHEKIEMDALAIVVMCLTPEVMHLSRALEKAMIKHSQTRKVAQMSIRTLAYLAFLQVYLARKAGLESDKVLYVNYAVQIAGVAFKHCALSYDKPPETLWSVTGECYQYSVKEGLLEMAVNHPLAEFQTLPTIALALKRLLLFCLTGPYRYSQPDILSLFDFCTQNSALVNFVDQDILGAQTFCWDYGTSSSYQPVYTRLEELSDDCVLLATRALNRSELKQSLNIEDVERVLNTFDHYQFLIESTVSVGAKPHVFACGFEQLVEFFTKHVHQQKILTINTPTPKQLNFSSMGLVKDKPQAPKPKMEQVESADIWGYKSEETVSLKIQFGAVKLVETSQPLFFIAETMEAKLVAEDLFVCFDMNLKPVLGVTRHVELEQRGVTQKSVVEMYAGDVSLLQLTGIVTRREGILLSNGVEQYLFIAPEKYKLGHVLKFDQVEVVLERLVELSPKFMCYAVSIR